MDNLSGKRSGMLTAIEPTEKKGNATIWRCVCDCGNICYVSNHRLKSGFTRSCGCIQKQIQKEANSTHGKSKTSEYKVWAAMKTRCLNPKHKRYKDYGGRGIAVCSEWLRFENFIADMGERPDGLTLDRINNDGNYEPSNCRWATWKEQASNRRAKQRVSKIS